MTLKFFYKNLHQIIFFFILDLFSSQSLRAYKKYFHQNIKTLQKLNSFSLPLFFSLSPLLFLKNSSLVCDKVLKLRPKIGKKRREEKLFVDFSQSHMNPTVRCENMVIILEKLLNYVIKLDVTTYRARRFFTVT